MQRSSSLDQTIAEGRGGERGRVKKEFTFFVYSSIDNALKVNSHPRKQPLLHTYIFTEGFKSNFLIHLQYFTESDSFLWNKILHNNLYPNTPCK